MKTLRDCLLEISEFEVKVRKPLLTFKDVRNLDFIIEEFKKVEFNLFRLIKDIRVLNSYTEYLKLYKVYIKYDADARYFKVRNRNDNIIITIPEGKKKKKIVNYVKGIRILRKEVKKTLDKLILIKKHLETPIEEDD